MCVLCLPAYLYVKCIIAYECRCVHICDCFEVQGGVVCQSLLRVVCAVVCICGTVNVKELFTYVVVYFGGLD